MAPELIEGYPYEKPVDIWSLGIMVMEVKKKYFSFYFKKIFFFYELKIFFSFFYLFFLFFFFQMAEGLPPYFNHKPKKATQLIAEQGAPPLKNEKMWSPEFKDFVAKCLMREAQKRATVRKKKNYLFSFWSKKKKFFQQNIYFVNKKNFF
jgi:serine/threonine protein kinase